MATAALDIMIGVDVSGMPSGVRRTPERVEREMRRNARMVMASTTPHLTSEYLALHTAQHLLTWMRYEDEGITADDVLCAMDACRSLAQARDRELTDMAFAAVGRCAS